MRVLCLLAAALGSLNLAWGQATFATITGTVTDLTGAVIPAATLQLVNENTGISRSVTSDASGTYEFTHLIAGTYSVTAQAPGFKTFRLQGIAVESLRTVRIDIRVEVGEVGVEVTVQASAPVIETDVPSIADVKTQLDLRDLPLNIRSTVSGTGDSGLYRYVFIAPTGYQGGGSRFSLGGGRGSQNYFNIDGISSNSPAFGNSIGPATPSFDSIQEVRFEMVNNKAEFGQVANITAITKSGTNDIHGGLFHYHENAALNARPFFAATRGQNIRNNFGFSIGGPVIKNKMFFFGTYEGERQRIPAIITPNMPTTLMRQGDFSQLLQQANPILVRNPFADRTPFANNVIPASLLNQGSVRWQDRFFPLPNFGPSNLTVANYRDTIAQQIQHNQYDLRVDYSVTNNNNLYVRWSWKNSQPQVLDSGLPPELTGRRVQVREARQLAISDTWTITPRLINEFKAGFARNYNPREGILIGQELVDMIGIQGLEFAPGVNNVPTVSIVGFHTVNQLAKQAPAENTFQYVDQITFIQGRHTWKSGIEFRPQQYNNFVLPQFGTYAFTAFASGYSYADFLLGLPNTTSRNYLRPPRDVRFYFLSGFVQDDFKMTQNLTLSMGVRYEYNRPARDRRDTIFNVDPFNGRLVVPNQTILDQYVHPLFPSQIPIVTAATAGFPERSLRFDDRNNFQPRIGFAWRPMGGTKTVFRGGYGMFNDDLTADVASPMYGGPFSVTESFVNGITSNVPLLTFQRPFLDRGTTGNVDVTGLTLAMRNPYAQQWNLTIERDLGLSTGLRLSYIGTKSTNLIYGRNHNQPEAASTPFQQSRRPFPLYRNMIMRENGGNHVYHALSTEFERKWQRGLSYMVTWTWAKNLTDVDETGGVEGGTTIENAFNRARERGNAQFSPRHRFISTVIWELPFGAGKPFLSAGGAAGKILGGWQLSGSFIAQGGEYLTPVFAGADPSNTQTIGGIADRIGTGNLPSGERSIHRWFDSSAFAVPANGRFGNSGRGILEGPGRQIASAALFKTVSITERVQFRIQASFTNLFNRANFNNPALNISAPNAVTRITNIQTRDLAGPRNALLGARIDF
ncbi:MAG: carboxypeptidase regulatory-like domain-containing protein [Bryobacterales bacterium]|nr:carboxypeptidase regulatory-like domain-containing protein [Bryobacterales bacterium]